MEDSSEEKIERRIIKYVQDTLMAPKLSEWAKKYVIGDMPEEPTALEVISEVSFIDGHLDKGP